MHPLIPIQYARVTLDNGRHVTLQLTEDSARWLKGWEVRRRDGERITTVDKAGTEIDRMHWIDKTAITKRIPLRMNTTYGTLEPVRPARKTGGGR